MFDKIKALFSGKKTEPDKQTVKEPDSSRRAWTEERDKPRRSVSVAEDREKKIKPEPVKVSEEKTLSGQAEGQRKPEAMDRRPADKERLVEGRQSRKTNDSGRVLYRFLNQAIKTMHIRYSEGRFDDLTHLGKIPASLMEDYEQTVGKLPDDLQAWLSALRAMIVLRDQDGAVYTDIADKEGIKREFLNMMLPFYGTYARELGQGKVRFSSLIGPDMLRLFHELTGKKFSIGFHRRYESGINAFEWEGDRYKVFDSRGILLCDAVFKEGIIESGFARLKEPDPEFEDWDIVRTGDWKEGVFQNGAVCYAYRIPVQ